MNENERRELQVHVPGWRTLKRIVSKSTLECALICSNTSTKKGGFMNSTLELCAAITCLLWMYMAHTMYMVYSILCMYIHGTYNIQEIISVHTGQNQGWRQNAVV